MVGITVCVINEVIHDQAVENRYSHRRGKLLVAGVFILFFQHLLLLALTQLVHIDQNAVDLVS